MDQLCHGLLQRHEQAVIFQPIGIFQHKTVVIRRFFKAVKGQPQNLGAVFIERAEIHTSGIVAPLDGLGLLPQQKTLVDQGVQIDQVGIAGEGRKGLIGGIAVARGA